MMSERSPRLSKSTFMSGAQCHKRLYLDMHQPELAAETDEMAQAVMKTGTEVGVLARSLFPSGVLVEHDHEHLSQALMQTAALLKDLTVPAIFEGTFFFDGVIVRVDVLKRVGRASAGRWRLIEVKAASKVKDEHHDDVAIQAYVVKGAGVDLAGSWLLHLNTGYVYTGGELDLTQFFARASLTAEVTKRLPGMPQRLATLRTMLRAPAPPSIEPGGHCSAPYDCPFWNHCTKDKPARWVFSLPRVGATFERLTAQGIDCIDDIPEDFPLSPLQRLVKNQQEWINKVALKAHLHQLRYPIHHLDFETVGFAIPRYPGSRPYQQVPFQWSNHIESGDGTIRHEEFLHQGPNDPREALARALLASLGKKGSICVYHAAFEGRIIRELSETLPKLKKPLLRLLPRLWDLKEVIRRTYYHPGFEGSYSLKSVLPALLPALGYDDLDIQDGGMASQVYAQMQSDAIDDAERARLTANLRLYCGRDTLAMVELRRFFWTRLH